MDLDLAGASAPPDPRQSTEVFRIMQEALTNVARHAQASRARISLKESEGALLLTVDDDGRGVAESDLTRPDALGLLGMRERADSLGADLTIEGRPGRGTTVQLRVPMK